MAADGVGGEEGVQDLLGGDFAGFVVDAFGGIARLFGDSKKVGAVDAGETQVGESGWEANAFAEGKDGFGFRGGGPGQLEAGQNAEGDLLAVEIGMGGLERG